MNRIIDGQIAINRDINEHDIGCGPFTALGRASGIRPGIHAGWLASNLIVVCSLR